MNINSIKNANSLESKSHTQSNTQQPKNFESKFLPSSLLKDLNRQEDFELSSDSDDEVVFINSMNNRNDRNKNKDNTYIIFSNASSGSTSTNLSQVTNPQNNNSRHNSTTADFKKNYFQMPENMRKNNSHNNAKYDQRSLFLMNSMNGMNNGNNVGNLSNVGNLGNASNLSNMSSVSNLSNMSNMSSVSNLGNAGNLGNLSNANPGGGFYNGGGQHDGFNQSKFSF